MADAPGEKARADLWVSNAKAKAAFRRSVLIAALRPNPVYRRQNRAAWQAKIDALREARRDTA